MNRPGGRYTVRGGDDVEEAIGALVTEVAETARDVLHHRPYKALVLIGGYGRGEGGVEVLDGKERPHNNLDFLLVTEGRTGKTPAEIKEALDARLESLEERHGIGIDLGVIPAAKLRRGPRLVMWYDMRFGHKTVLGDSRFVPSLSRYNVDHILPADLLWLLVNRGSQILVGRILIGRGSVDKDERKFIVRLTMKAIVAYGDALLFSLHDYHWSYQEKARRMWKQRDVSQPFKSLYEEAIEFRFQPRYAEYDERDLEQWLDDLQNPLEDVHRRFESWRMRRANWNWDTYPSACLGHAFLDRPLSPRATARKLLHCLQGPGPGGRKSLSQTLAYRAAGRRGLLPAYFPVPMYGPESESLRREAGQALGARDESLHELRRAFLRTWGQLVDPNFFKVSDRFNLALDPEEAAA